MSGRLFANGFGYFVDKGDEYVITRPDTPKPWVNVISNGDYGLIISQTGGGYSWRTHAKFNRLTRWKQDLVKDEWGKYIYLRDNDVGDFWSLTWKPVCRPPKRYECRHGLGYTTISSLNAGIESTVTLFVPLDEPLEVWYVRLHNRSDRPRHLSLFSTQWNRSWNYIAFHAASPSPAGFECDKEAFLGMYGSVQYPRAVVRGQSPQREGRWGDPIGSLRVDVSLAPGEEKAIIFTLGAVEELSEAERLVAKYRDAKAVQEALTKVKDFWRKLLFPLWVETPDRAFDIMNNIWLKYQAISGRLWGRTGYYQPGGAYGFRDQLQDCQVFLLIGRPDLTLEQIRLHARHQFQDGTVHHWWHPIAETGAVTRISDDLLWLPFVTIGYLKETADFAALDVVEPYVDGGEGSLYDHCRRAIDGALSRFSPRGLPLIGEGDWNDGMSAVGCGMRGESVWLGHFLYAILKEFAYIASQRGEEETATRYTARAEELKASINKHAWDGEWYIRATDDEGRVLGSQQCAEGQIFLNAQTWAVIAGTATPERAEAAMDAVERLLEREYGLLLFYPAYTQVDSRIGYLTRYAPGTRENGGIYTHAVTWAILAECLLGRAESAYRIYCKINPIRRGLSPKLYQAEPYVTSGSVDGPDSPHFGRGGWTWYTGSAAWLLKAGIEGILGVRPTYKGLIIDPCIPPEWDGFKLERSFRGAIYKIEVKNPYHTGHGVQKVLVDGSSVENNLIPAFSDGGVHTIQITLSKELWNPS
ncbi:MAG: hypothetical protein B1H11_05200 [Desulfobacteraceae bacterium 4484_190.1]|nr:MAG: hypothetical protein B1H11_05200 [Desulfobacteraceae bacterium 4484_190.1]